MSSEPFEGKAFQTAAARRGGKPIKFKVEHWEFNDDDDDDEGTLVELVLMIDPKVDVVRLGTSFAGYGKTLGKLKDDTLDETEKVAIIDVEVPKLRDSMRMMFTPPSRAKWDRVAEAFDIAQLGEVIKFVSSELSSLDPTQQPSSTIGSASDTTSSTDGAQHEG